MKVIAFYLPQYHEIKENNEWWGKGFTEWTTLKKAKPLFEGHYQPRVPLNNDYYDLSDVKVMERQCKMAREYGIYGFCMYHYWFDGHMLLEKPMEQYLADKNCDLPFCICWANEHWTKAWESKENTILIEQNYGDQKQWKEHYVYFRQFFLDKRYICEENKPLLVIYRPELITNLNEMLDFWNDLAKNDNFSGMKYAYQHVSFDNIKYKDDSRFDYAIEYQPSYGYRDLDYQFIRFLKNVKSALNRFTEKTIHLTIDVQKITNMNTGPRIIEYDRIWKIILKRVPPSSKYIPGAFTDWDNSPRRGNLGTVYSGASPLKFAQYFKSLVGRAKDVYHQDKIFVFAWNEWTEGGYLEPDQKYRYGYLEGIRNALIETGEMPDGYGQEGIRQ